LSSSPSLPPLNSFVPAHKPDDRRKPYDSGAHADGKRTRTVLDRSCRDCHSNGTVWPWYTQVAPLSWLMTQAVREGRNVVNFSEWAAYQPAQQRLLLALSCEDATNGKMPGAYTLLRPETRLSPQDVETICGRAPG
jgi:hypothetical protein